MFLHAKLDHVLETIGNDGTAVASKTNCSNCGTRVAVDADRCEYCEGSSTDDTATADADRNRADGLVDDETPDYGWVGK